MAPEELNIFFLVPRPKVTLAIAAYMYNTLHMLSKIYGLQKRKDLLDIVGGEGRVVGGRDNGADDGTTPADDEFGPVYLIQICRSRRK